jgi:hypothetical protein
MVGDIKYHDIALKRDFVIDTLRSNGFTIETEDILPPPAENHDTGLQGFMFFQCAKNSL